MVNVQVHERVPDDGAPVLSGYIHTGQSLVSRKVLNMFSGILVGQHAAALGLCLLQHERPTCCICRASPDQASTSGHSHDDSYLYNSGSPTERKKATIEHVYQEVGGAREGPPSPWNMGWQMNERNLVWNDDLKARLLKVSVPHLQQQQGPRFQLPFAFDLQSIGPIRRYMNDSRRHGRADDSQEGPGTG